MFFVQLAGHLGKDPETRFTPSGQKVTSFSMAVSQRRGKDKEEVTIWVRVTIWGDRFDKLISFLKKGSAVIVGGRMNPPSLYTDKEGKSQATLEVTAEMIEFSPFGMKSDRQNEGAMQNSGNYSASSNNSSGQYAQSVAYGSGSQGEFQQDLDEDKIPF